MREPIVVAALAAVLGGCAASSKQVKQARQAEYTCQQAEVFEAVVDVMKDQFPPLEGMDARTGAVVSQMRWHDHYGRRYQAGAAEVGEGAVMVGAEALVQQGTHGGWVVLARAHVFGHDMGSPAGVEYKPGDPRWPAWVDGKMDNFFVKIWDKLPQCRPAEGK
ncbi:MAG TPA: hypothetical protein VL172_07550 [Kofleriaceae bacterium]|nr:hypothetical protein [Kofleriaceae bacterium]